jgi:methylenetetrahydrofolate dehydrogenase (NADP+) / methenyltetrahydrofolate cyclohydrolase
MTATIIDGAAVSARVRDEVAAGVAELRAAGGPVPGLATVLVGSDPASQVYVRNKNQATEKAGMRSFHHELPAATPQAELDDLIARLNDDRDVHGILVQSPLPDGLDEQRAFGLISPQKDVDGFHPWNVGQLALGRPGLRSCTPAGVMELLRDQGVELVGADAVVIGRSNIVGKPLSMMLLAAHCTVTVTHSRTRDLAAHARRADILVAAIGRARFVTADMVKPGAVVIDVGMNRIDDPTTKNGTRLVGDVDFDGVRRIASKITPVPGGVGKMTIAMLMQNAVRAAEMQSR